MPLAVVLEILALEALRELHIYSNEYDFSFLATIAENCFDVTAEVSAFSLLLLE